MPTHTPVMTEPTVPPRPPAPPPPRQIGQPTDNQSPETLRLYRGDWTAFAAWCRAQNLSAMPAAAATLATYLTAQAAQTSRPTLARRKAAIAAMHRAQGLPAPTLDHTALAALRTACRTGPAPKRLAPRSPPAALRRLARLCPADLAGLRDRALLLLVAATTPEPGVPSISGPGSGVPMGRLLLLDAEHVRFESDAVVLTLRSRADDEKPDWVVPVPRATTAIDCPVRALEAWLRGSNTRFGPIFKKVDRWGHAEHTRLGPDALRRIVRARYRTPGPDPGLGQQRGAGMKAQCRRVLALGQLPASHGQAFVQRLEVGKPRQRREQPLPDVANLVLDLTFLPARRRFAGDRLEQVVVRQHQETPVE